MQQVKNIIFDLGGVIMNIDFSRTELAFSAMGFENFSSMITQHHANELFIQLETGMIQPTEFYQAFREETGMDFADEAIKDAWNALILDFRIPSLHWIDGMKDRYQLFLFSNTNQIHHAYFTERYRTQTGRGELDQNFRKAYYSQQMGMRKPDIAPFLYILEQEKLNPAETVFIDDTLKNVIAAKEAGMEAIHLQWPQKLEDLDGYFTSSKSI